MKYATRTHARIDMAGTPLPPSLLIPTYPPTHLARLLLDSKREREEDMGTEKARVLHQVEWASVVLW